jgi:mRNA-degrading endonuclease toxin of MazEF toxin-antitoxin module
MPSLNPKRGEIYWVLVPAAHTVGTEQQKRRPWIIFSDDATVTQSLVIAVPLSLKVHKQNRQYRILVTEANVLRDPGSSLIPGDRVALTEQIRSLSLDRLEPQRQGRLTDTALYAVEAGVAFVLAMPTG